MPMRSFKDLCARRATKFGSQFDPSGLHNEFVTAYESQERVTVSFRDKNGKEYERKRGTIGVTTGWKPAFLLMLTSRSLGSHYLLGPNDKIVG